MGMDGRCRGDGAMSYATVTYLYCDPCVAEGNTEPYSVDPPASTRRGDGGGSAASVRWQAKRSGWRYVKGRDICEECWEAGKR